MGTLLDVLDLFFTPFPQFLLELGIECLLVRRRDACPGSEILKKIKWIRVNELTNHRQILEARIIPTLPFSSAAAGVVPAYKEVIAPYEVGYVVSRPKIFIATPALRARSVDMVPGCKEMDTTPSPP